MRTFPIDLPSAALNDFCRRHRVRKMSLFGSVLRNDFRPDSDLDVLVEFSPDDVPGLRFFSMQNELSELLGRKVDLNTRSSMSRYFLNDVIRESKPVYGANATSPQEDSFSR